MYGTSLPPPWVCSSRSRLARDSRALARSLVLIIFYQIQITYKIRFRKFQQFDFLIVNNTTLLYWYYFCTVCMYKHSNMLNVRYLYGTTLSSLNNNNIINNFFFFLLLFLFLRLRSTMPIRIAILSLKQILEILFCLKRFGKKSGDSFSSSFKRFGPVGLVCGSERRRMCVSALMKIQQRYSYHS